MRLIDADELLKSAVCLDGICHACVVGVDDIKSAPTIDPESLRPRGEWEEIRNLYGNLEGWIHTECGREVICAEKYCPGCGAKTEESK